ncbi:hypothetical protein SSP531S_14330 [Streptomyces spongiicola]|uniref:Uncharacterized protein n=1 Tax=Streptomyces spongiicola TaxID=1690221 RepID=A0A388STV8_9ACTN|nr:hypothetical protein SSP531S_14330 [Streptomyces spongiicola]
MRLRCTRRPTALAPREQPGSARRTAPGSGPAASGAAFAEYGRRFGPGAETAITDAAVTGSPVLSSNTRDARARRRAGRED